MNRPSKFTLICLSGFFSFTYLGGHPHSDACLSPLHLHSNQLQKERTRAGRSGTAPGGGVVAEPRRWPVSLNG
uniref:Secreted protein n=1 Tax=Helianthus annuus TaxID=4232 RepID=A0A251V350_HELAN